jgi:hypothetical protein
MPQKKDRAPAIQPDRPSWITRANSRLNRILTTQDELRKAARQAFLKKRTERTPPRLAIDRVC